MQHPTESYRGWPWLTPIEDLGTVQVTFQEYLHASTLSWSAHSQPLPASEVSSPTKSHRCWLLGP